MRQTVLLLHIAGGLALRVQLPFVAPAGPAKPSPLDLAVRAQAAKARGKALAEQRRSKVLEEKEEQLAALKELQAGVSRCLMCVWLMLCG
jgi:hypothetical protein